METSSQKNPENLPEDFEHTFDDDGEAHESRRTDLLRVGETLTAGNYKESPDGRTRLYLTSEGDLRLYIYVPNRRRPGRTDFANERIRIWSRSTAPPNAGPGSTLRMFAEGYGSGRFRIGCLRLFRAGADYPIWSAGNAGPALPAVWLGVNDGNAAIYAGNGHVYWDADPRSHHAPFFRQPLPVPPERPVINLEVGQIGVGTSNFTIENNEAVTMIVRDSTKMQTLPPGEEIPVSGVGQIQIQCAKYAFNVADPSPARLDADSADAYPVLPGSTRVRGLVTRRSNQDRKIKVPQDFGDGTRLTG